MGGGGLGSNYATMCRKVQDKDAFPCKLSPIAYVYDDLSTPLSIIGSQILI